MARGKSQDRLIKEHSVELSEAYYSNGVPSTRYTVGLRPSDNEDFTQIVEQICGTYYFETLADEPVPKILNSWKITKEGFVNA
jgi:hypothetical protein